MGVDAGEKGAEFSSKDYQDPPPAPLIDIEELTKWSLYRAVIAEFIATLLFLYITVATVIGYKHQSDTTLPGNTDGACSGVGILGISWAFGGMIFVLVYCTAGISGGHINPAVTFGLFLARKVSLVRAVLYMIAQCLGAICGVGFVKAFQSAYYSKYGGGANELNSGYTKGTGLAAEIIGTFVLVYTVFAATDPKRNARDSHVPETISENPPSSHSSCSEAKKVDQNLLGIPVSDNAGKIATMLGKLVRAHVPISYISWNKVPGIYKDNVWNELVKIYELDPLSNEMFLKRMAEDFRRYKKNLRVVYYDPFNNDEERLKNCPPTVAQEDWAEFVKNEAMLEASGRREVGKKNRTLLSYAHHAGRKSHAKIEQEMIVASSSTNISRRQVWEKTHRKKDGSISDATSSYFDQIAKAKEKITDSDEEKLTVDEDILSQVLGKDARGRSRGVGTVIPKTKVKACAIAQKRLRHVHGEHDELKMRVGNLEDTVGNLSGKMEVLINMVGNIEQGIRAPVNSSDGGRATQFNAPEFVASQFQNSIDVANNQRCDILNSDLDIIAKGTVCRDSTSSKIHGKSVPPTHEKVVLDNILLPDEITSKINHQFAETFAEVGVGGYVCHPKGLIHFL